MQLFDPRHPFFKPRWRRFAIVGVCVAWAGVEFWMGSPGFAALFLLLAAYCGWMFRRTDPSGGRRGQDTSR